MTILCIHCALRASPSAGIPAPASETKSVCPACLDSLAPTAIASLSASIRAGLQSLGRPSTFSLSIVLPPGALARAAGHTGVAGTGVRDDMRRLLSEGLEGAGEITADSDVVAEVYFSGAGDRAVAESVCRAAGVKVKNGGKKFGYGKKARGSGGGAGGGQVGVGEVEKAIQELGEVRLREVCEDVRGGREVRAAEVSAKVTAGSLLFAGRYNKWSRQVSQTPWFIGEDVEDEGATVVVTCVEQAVTSGLREVFGGKTAFVAGGREDVDVRMLGGGRPFTVAISGSGVCRQAVEKEKIALAVRRTGEICAESGIVSVRGLQMVRPEYAEKMRSCEAEKRKRYRCVVWMAGENLLGEDEVRKILEKDNERGGMMLVQKTPLRVLHRRALLARERKIYEMKVLRFVGKNAFVLELVSQAGTYIKELVHGDSGRTVPSVSYMLGCDADILQLDVADVEFPEVNAADAF